MDWFIISILISLFFIWKYIGDIRIRKAIGITAITLGVFLMSPFPDFSDLIGLPLFSFWKGITIGLDTLPQHFLEYTYFTTMVGLGLLVAGLFLLRWNYPKLRRFMK